MCQDTGPGLKANEKVRGQLRTVGHVKVSELMAASCTAIIISVAFRSVVVLTILFLFPVLTQKNCILLVILLLLVPHSAAAAVSVTRAAASEERTFKAGAGDVRKRQIGPLQAGVAEQSQQSVIQRARHSDQNLFSLPWAKRKVRGP
jgi:hypothetical protein